MTLRSALLLVVLSASGCAHAPATSKPVLPTAHPVTAWSGMVRIAVGTHELLDENEATLVQSTISGLLASVGSDVKVHCVAHEGDRGGVLHARVRLEFPERMTLEQKFATLGLLQGLSPTGEAYRLEEPLVGAVSGPAQRR